MRLRAMLVLPLVVLVMTAGRGVASAAKLESSEVGDVLTRASQFGEEGYFKEMDDLLASLGSAVPMSTIDAVRTEGYVNGVSRKLAVTKRALDVDKDTRGLTFAYDTAAALGKLSAPEWLMAESDRKVVNDHFAKEMEGVVASLIKLGKKVTSEEKVLFVHIRALADQLGIPIDVPASLKVLASPKASLSDEKTMAEAITYANHANTKKMEDKLAQISKPVTINERNAVRSHGYTNHIQDIFTMAEHSLSGGLLDSALSSYQSAVKFFRIYRGSAGDTGDEMMIDAFEKGQTRLFSLLGEYVEEADKKNQKVVSALLGGIRKTGAGAKVPPSLAHYINTSSSTISTGALTGKSNGPLWLSKHAKAKRKSKSGKKGKGN